MPTTNPYALWQQQTQAAANAAIASQSNPGYATSQPIPRHGSQPNNAFLAGMYDDFTHVPLPDIKPGENPYNNQAWVEARQNNWEIDQVKKAYDSMIAKWKAQGIDVDALRDPSKRPFIVASGNEQTVVNPVTGERKPYNSNTDLAATSLSFDLPKPVVDIPREVYSFPGTSQAQLQQQLNPPQTPKPIVWQNTQAPKAPTATPPNNIRIPDLSSVNQGPLGGNLFSTINGLQNRSISRTPNYNPFANPTQPMGGSLYRPIKVSAGVY